MNIVEFINRFSDVINYNFELSIDGVQSDDIKTNKDLASRDNFKGKMVSFYELKDRKKVNYIPINSILLPINIKVESGYDGTVLFIEDDSIPMDSSTIRTGEKDNLVLVKLFDKDSNQYGFITLYLNLSGDIISQTCNYQNYERTHLIYYSVYYVFLNAEKIIKSEITEYTEKDYDNNIDTIVKIYHQDGITTGIEVIREKLRTDEDIIQGDEISNDDIYYHFARTEGCTDYSHEDITTFRRNAHENFVFEANLTRFRREKENFEMQMHNLKVIPIYLIKRLFNYHIDNSNDLLNGFIGEYTGNTFVRNGDKLTLIIRTSDEEFNYYTEFDLTGVDPFIVKYNTNYAYFERIKQGSKVPKFKTKIINGKECLIPQNGEFCTEDELAEFEKFRYFYHETFEELNAIKVKKLLQQ